MPAKSRIVAIHNLEYASASSQFIECSSADSAMVMVDAAVGVEVFVMGAIEDGGTTYEISKTAVPTAGSIAIPVPVAPLWLRVIVAGVTGVDDYVLLRRSIS